MQYCGSMCHLWHAFCVPFTSDLHTTRPPTQSWQLQEVVLTQFVSPDDEHDVLETCGELKIKINT
jgi:hypothetical protein